MRIVACTLWILAGLYLTADHLVHAETTSVAMVPKAQLDALQKEYNKLEDRLRVTPQCLRMWTNLRRTELSL